MKAVGTQTIETERLILRRITPDDAPYMFKGWTGDPLVSRYVTWDRHTSLEMSREYANFKANRYANNDFCFDWIVVLKEIGKPIGEIEAVHVSQYHNLVEMGDCYGSPYWNHGYATEALKAFIRYMFDVAEVDKIVAYHISSNPASGRVMQKAGMHFDACLKNYLWDKTTGKRADQIWYSIDRT